VHRETGEQIPVPIDWVYDNALSEEKFGLYRYTYRTVIDWTRLYREHHILQEGIYDAFVALDYYHRSAQTLLRLGRARYITRQLTPETRGQGDATTMHIIPYFTVGHRNLSFEMTEFTNDNYAYLNHVMKFAPLKKTHGLSANVLIKHKTTAIISLNTCARRIPIILSIM